MKVVINKCFGGYGLSDAAVQRYAELAGITLYSKPGTLYSNYYYTVPVEEYERLRKKGEKIGDYSESNSVYWSIYDIERNDPLLIQVVEELGDDAAGDFSRLKIVEIPDDVSWEIDEYDGIESIHEVHRTWR